MQWDPSQYQRYADERGRPFIDLLAQVGAHAPRTVVDLGCGPGNLTALLRERWPAADIIGIDSSPEMIKRAQDEVYGPRFIEQDVREWQPSADTDVVITNATLQWIPEHVALVRSWLATLPAGAWFAAQVPSNFASPSHRLMRELAASPRWAPQLAGVLRHDDVVGPEVYARLLLDAGLSPSVWQTNYLHVLPGVDPVLEWVRGTGLRPILTSLPADEVNEFEAEYAALLRAAYPRDGHGTIFPFLRTFFVGHRPTSSALGAP
jgi:trans-aconitate 2-methyltransferase